MAEQETAWCKPSASLRDPGSAFSTRFRDCQEPDTAISPRLFVVADIGGPNHYHLGDEAMLEANLQAFRELIPEIQFTVPSRNPDWTSRRYGVESLAFPKVPFGDCPNSWAQKLASTESTRALRTDWLGKDIRESLRSSSGLVVSGGGNICSTWPEKVLERVALIEYAVELRLPVVIVGQTLGPSLTPDQCRLLAEALRQSAWIGVREEGSAKLALALGVSAERLHKQRDDALFLCPVVVDDERVKELHSKQQPWIIVTLDASFGFAGREHSLRVLANQLDALAEYLHATLVFVPHVGGVDAGEALSDAVAGRALAAQLRSQLVLLDLWQPSEVRWLIEQAAMIVSTRYHPLVFATAAGVAAIGIYLDEYTRTKLRGALTPAGLENYCISLKDAEQGALFPLAAELWSRRNTVADRLASLWPEAWLQETRRWDEICQALNLQPKASRRLPSMPSHLANSAKLLPLQHTQKGFMSGIITEDQWQQYEQKGYLRLGKVLPEPELAAFQERLNQIMLGKVQHPTLQMQLDTGGAYEDLPEAVVGFPGATLGYRKIQGLEADPFILEFIRRDLFRDICARHYGSHASVSIFRVMMMNKPAGKGTYLPWHQDAGDVWKLDRDPLVTTWIALDPATRANGCIQIVPGTHRLGLLSRQGSTISQSNAELYCPNEAIEYLELEPGEGLLLHNWLLHRSDINHTAIPRRALSVCYMDGRTLNTLTGTRFPIVFGEPENTDSALPFLQGIKEENSQLREMAAEAKRYAHSLLEDNQRREQMRCEAERYAKALEEELAQVRGMAAAASKF